MAVATVGATGTTELAEIDRICRLKHAYLRLLDLKRFEELGALLDEDCTASYEDGRLSYHGREAIVGFLDRSLSGGGIITSHSCHHPEIEMTGPATATGTWYLKDRVIIPAADLEIAGAALYEDRYSKTDGCWQILHTGYRRIFEEHRSHRTHELSSFRSRFGG